MSHLCALSDLLIFQALAIPSPVLRFFFAMAQAASDIADEGFLSHGDVLVAHEMRMMQFMEERFLRMEQSLKAWLHDHWTSPRTSQRPEPNDLEMGIRVAASLAEETLSKAIDELPSGVDDTPLLEAIPLLQWPLPAQCIAQAYCKVVEVRAKSPSSCEDLLKHVQLVIREVLVLKICASNLKLTTNGFRWACERAFGRKLLKETHSQLELSRSAVYRQGSDRKKFKEFVDKKLSGWDGNQDALFGVYQECVRQCGEELHFAKEYPSAKKRRHKKHKASCTTISIEVEASEEPQHADADAETEGMPLPSSTMKTAAEHWLDGGDEPDWAKNALTANTFVPSTSSSVGMLQCSHCQSTFTCEPADYHSWFSLGQVYCSHCKFFFVLH